MHFVVIGGVSVNDKTHDAFPYNFINSGVRKAKKIAGDVTVVIYAPSYVRRVENQSKEHSTVTVTQSCSSADVFGYKITYWCEDNKRHFLDVTKKAVLGAGKKYKEISTAADLTSVLVAESKIESIHYFGHSNPDSLFLEYSSVSPGSSMDYWGASDAASVPKANFASGAQFVSYGCNQGDRGGLAEKLHALWDITATGSDGKTDFGPIGRGETYPTSANGYYQYDSAGRSAVTIGP